MTASVHHEKGHIEVGHTRDKKVPLKLYYEKTGNGPKKLLLIMGLNSPGSAWDTVVRLHYIAFAVACASCSRYEGIVQVHSVFAI